MDEKLQWQFEIVDKMSTAAERIADALAKQEERLAKADAATKKHTETQENASGKSVSLGKHIADLSHDFHDMRENVEDAAEHLMRLGERIYELGAHMVEAAAHAEKLQMSLSLVLGEKPSEELLDYIEAVGIKTAHTRAELEAAGQQLAFKGFEGRGLVDALAAAQDIEAAGGNLGAALEKLGTIKATGRLKINSVGELGLDKKTLLDQLSKLTGESSKAVEKEMKSGAIDPDILLRGVYKSLEAKEGGKLGARAVAAGGTVDALLHKLEGAPETLFAGMSKKNAGYEAFRGALSNMVTLLDPSSEIGSQIEDRLSTIFSGFMTTVFGDLSGPDGAKKLEHAVEGVLDKLDGMAKWVGAHKDDIAAVFHGVAETVETVAGWVGKLVGLMGKLYEGEESFAKSQADKDAGIVFREKGADGTETALDEKDRDALLERAGKGGFFHKLFSSDETLNTEMLTQRYYEAGMEAAKGFHEGLADGADGAKPAGEKVADAAADGVRDKLEIHSPSRVFESYGAYTAEGFARGIERGGAMVADATDGAFDIAAPRIASSGRAAGAGVTVSAPIVIGDIVLTDGSRESAEQLRAHLDELLPGALEAAFERAAVQLGAA